MVVWIDCFIYRNRIFINFDRFYLVLFFYIVGYGFYLKISFREGKFFYIIEESYYYDISILLCDCVNYVILNISMILI